MHHFKRKQLENLYDDVASMKCMNRIGQMYNMKFGLLHPPLLIKTSFSKYAYRNVQDI